MSGARTEQIKEALRAYMGPRDAAAILLMAANRQRARQARNDRDSVWKKLETIAFANLLRSPPHLCGWAVKISRPCRSKKIISLCAKRFSTDELELTYSELMSRRRKLAVVRARQVAMWVIKKATRNSYPEIGRIMDRDHTTILHGVWRIEKMMAEDEAFRDRVEAILNEVTLLPSALE